MIIDICRSVIVTVMHKYNNLGIEDMVRKFMCRIDGLVIEIK